MPRHSRIHTPGLLYYVIARGNNGQQIFSRNSDFAAVLDALAQVRQRYPFYLYAYGFMSNHFHLLLEVIDFSTSQIMQSLLTRCADAFLLRIGEKAAGTGVHRGDEHHTGRIVDRAQGAGDRDVAVF
jgi:REP element-mobilizing transposase RayT